MPEAPIREFRLARGQPDGFSPFLSEDGAFLGNGLPLLERVGRQWRPRSERDLDGALAKASGSSARIGWRMESLATIARALNRGDRSLAAIALVQAEFPTLTKGNPDVASEPRDAKGRWTLSAAGRKFIQSHETIGGRPNLKPYGDIANHPTIGFGHKIRKDESYPNGITSEKAQDLFDGDIGDVEKTINDYVNVPLTQSQFDALASFSYNEGTTAFAGSTLLRLLNQGDYDGAANAFDDWTRAGKDPHALKNRRDAEKAMFTNGVYP
ncbi:MAG TPA: lysozyme [Magnetospirillaceae bacterium]|jgi:lysozyme